MVTPRFRRKLSGGQAPRVGAEAYNAASRTHPDLRRWNPFPGSADADLLPELGTIMSRSRDLDRNHGVAGGALQTQADNIVGTGLRLSARPDYRLLGRDKEWAMKWANSTEALFRTWWSTTACDAAHELVGDGITTQVFRSGFLNGAGLVLPLWIPDPRPMYAQFSTRLQVVEPDRLCNPGYAPDRDGLRGGIEFGAYGEPVAYHIKKTHPGERYTYMGRFSYDWERIPARTPWGRMRVIHVHDKERAGQSRGKPALAAVMRQFKVLGDLTGAELKASVVNAMVAMVAESSIEQEGLIELLQNNPEALKNYQEGLSTRGRAGVDFNAGMIIPLRLGEKLAGFTPGRPSQNFEAFVTTIFRHIAAGLNMPYELLMKDFSKTNYSSARAALLEAWRFFKGRRQWLATYFMAPVYTIWLEEAVNAGLVDAPGFYDNMAAYTRARWIGPGRGWVDPAKEALAAELRMDNLLSTLEDECAEQGLDWEEVLEQRAIEISRIRDLKLEFLLPSTQRSVATRAAVGRQMNEPDPPPDSGGGKPAAPSQPSEAAPEAASVL